MNDQQNSGRPQLDLHRADRMPSLLAGSAINAVRADKAALVVKDERRKFEGDSVMLSLVEEILRSFPFVAQCVYTHCIPTRRSGRPHFDGNPY